jgi:voltage-gated potassium channel
LYRGELLKILPAKKSHMQLKREDATHEKITDGKLTDEQMHHLEELRYKLGLSKLEANKAIKAELNKRSSHLFCRHCGKRP